MRPRVAVWYGAVLVHTSRAKNQFPLEAGPVTGLRTRRDVWTRKHELSSQTVWRCRAVCARGAEDKDEEEEERGSRKDGEQEVNRREKTEGGGEPNDAVAAAVATAACRSENDDEDRPMSCSVSLQTNKLVWLS